MSYQNILFVFAKLFLNLDISRSVDFFCSKNLKGILIKTFSHNYFEKNRRHFFCYHFVYFKITKTTPPNALIGSQLKDSSKDFKGEILIDAPDGLACFIITVPFFE